MLRCFVNVERIYSLKTWGSCLSSEQINSINTLFKRSYRCGFAKQINDIVTLVDNNGLTSLSTLSHPRAQLSSPQCKYNFRRNSFQSDLFLSTGMFNCFYSLSRFCSDVCDLLICTFDAYFIKLLRISYFLYETVLSNSIQQLLLVITNGRQEVYARTLTSVCKSGIL